MAKYTENKAKKDLRSLGTDQLQNMFFEFAVSAPNWVTDFMEAVPERKLRSLLIEKIMDMCTLEEIEDWCS